MNVDSICLGEIHLWTQPIAYEDLARVVGSGSTENFKRANAINVSFGMLA
jgi:hypothetical protein